MLRANPERTTMNPEHRIALPPHTWGPRLEIERELEGHVDEVIFTLYKNSNHLQICVGREGATHVDLQEDFRIQAEEMELQRLVDASLLQAADFEAMDLFFTAARNRDDPRRIELSGFTTYALVDEDGEVELDDDDPLKPLWDVLIVPIKNTIHALWNM